MDVPTFLERTGDAAFISDPRGSIVSWNPAAESLLGHAANSVLGRPCHAVLCGRDPFGNRYCRRDCNLREMIRRQEPIHGFELRVRAASGEYLAAACSIFAVSANPPPRDVNILHLLQRKSPGSKRSSPLEPVRARVRDSAVSLDSEECAEPTRLTPRESEVLGLIAKGYGVHEIAQPLGVSVNTIRTHIQNILRKLEVHSKLQAVTLARRRHLI